MSGKRWLEYVRLEDLRPDQRNPRAHSNIETLRASMGRWGYVEPVVTDERTGLLVAGHGRRTILLDDLAAGREPPEGVEVADDGSWLVPVNRGWESADDDEAFGYLVASNHIPEESGWIPDLLAEGLQRLASLDDLGGGLVGVGYTNDDLATMLAELAPQIEPEMRTDPDDVPEVPAKPITKPGDLWLLGAYVVCPHCGTHNDVSVG